MNRRDFIALTSAAAVTLPRIGWAKPLDYTEGLVMERLAAGETLFVDFKASWCGTCQAQERVLNALKEENPAYEQAITFINVDWDTYKDALLTSELNIPRRSTLVVLKGDVELGRIVAGTARKDIKALMDMALNAATA